MQRCIESTIFGRNIDYSYLQWISAHANKLSLKGITFFRNDGSIKVIAEGEEKKLEKLVKKLRRGRSFFSIFSPVENFSVIWHEPRNEFEDFSINENA
jgi:acylphosphatase